MGGAIYKPEGCLSTPQPASATFTLHSGRCDAALELMLCLNDPHAVFCAPARVIWTISRPLTQVTSSKFLLPYKTINISTVLGVRGMGIWCGAPIFS